MPQDPNSHEYRLRDARNKLVGLQEEFKELESIEENWLDAEEVISSGDWTVRQISQGGDVWWVLKNSMISIPFEEVKASGGLLQLFKDGQQCACFTDALTGANEYDEESDFPGEIVEALQKIGPW